MSSIKAMTQVNSNQLKRILAGTLLLGISFLPLLSQAASLQDLNPLKFRPNASSTKPDLSGTPRLNAANICNLMLGKLTQMQTRAQQKNSELLAKRTERQTNLTERKDNRLEKLETTRNKNDTRWEEFFAKLEAKAQNDSQKQAIASFRAAILAAIEAKRAAVDAANTAFQAKLQELTNSRKAAVDALAQTYRAEVNAAIEKAKVDCASGDPQTVRTTLAAALQTAKEKFNLQREQLDKVKEELSAAREEHQAAIKTAQETFRNAVERAQQEFRAAMASFRPAPTSSPSAAE